MSSLIVAKRFCGPDGMANGGYICGLIAARAPFAATVRLMKPVPLDTPLRQELRPDGLELLHGHDILAAARPGRVGELAPPRMPTLDEAADAARHFVGFSALHPAPHCFVCGPRRPVADGLSIFPGEIAPGIVAAPWTPDASLDAGDGKVASEFIWAALDCPGCYAVAPDLTPMLLGELTAEADRRVTIGEPCIVVGWGLAVDGRKYSAGTALVGADGKVCARARALWIRLRATGE